MQAMREHYPQTVAGWAANLEENWATAVALVLSPAPGPA